MWGNHSGVLGSIKRRKPPEHKHPLLFPERRGSVSNCELWLHGLLVMTGLPLLLARNLPFLGNFCHSNKTSY